jgi:hypothetical protein
MSTNSKRKYLIGVCGWQGAGKDTVADYLQNFHGFRRDSFASSLKDAVAAVFGWDRDMLEGRSQQSRIWREKVDPWWAERLGIPHLTPRWVLQYWGTDVCRQAFHDDIWIASLERKLSMSDDNVVISDVRFPNEITAIKKSGGQVVWVQRGPLPEWYECALLTNTTHEDDQWILHDNEQDMHHRYPEVHASEYSWVGTKFDAIFYNNSSIESLYDSVKSLVI